MTTAIVEEKKVEDVVAEIKAAGLQLENYDIEILIDQSGSMGTKEADGRTRWQHAAEFTQTLAQAAVEFDKDGITVVTFNDDVKTFESVDSAQKVIDIFAKEKPEWGTATDVALKQRLDAYFARKAAGNAKPVIIQVITDGAPNDRNAVERVIVEAANKLDKDEEVGIQFLQIGNDSGASAFLTYLDDELQGKGAKFDIVDAKRPEEARKLGIAGLLKEAIEG